MIERGKLDCGVVEIVDTQSLGWSRCEIYPWTQKNGVTIEVTPFSAPRKAK